MNKKSTRKKVKIKQKIKNTDNIGKVNIQDKNMYGIT